MHCLDSLQRNVVLSCTKYLCITVDVEERERGGERERKRGKWGEREERGGEKEKGRESGGEKEKERKEGERYGERERRERGRETEREKKRDGGKIRENSPLPTKVRLC